MIHLAKKELGLDDDLYRVVLHNVCGVDSAGDLDEPNRRKLLAYFRGKGFGKSKGAFPGKPHNFDDPIKNPMYRKIEALLADARRPWSYVDSIAFRMFKVKRLTFCTFDQLHKIVSAMVADASRNGRRAA